MNGLDLPTASAGFRPDLPMLLCLSHLRWDFVRQRPQHLMSLAAAEYSVVFFEEPVLGHAGSAYLAMRTTKDGVCVATPMLPAGLDERGIEAAQRMLLDDMLDTCGRPLDVAWYYTPMAFAFAGHLRPRLVVFDSMDELSAFRGAPAQLQGLEQRLLDRADLVFAGGCSLYLAKRERHPRVHLFSSSVEAAHFRAARRGCAALGEPADQAGLRRPRIGFFGVIDERIDYALIEAVAATRPDWELIMVGPTAKIDPALLPRHDNLYWLGPKAYAELPAYLAGWDAGWMPFALNEATRFISPTKTPEFLAAGIPLVCTPVADVVSDWGDDELVTIADGAAAVVAALARALTRERQDWLALVDERIDAMSWGASWQGMRALIAQQRARTNTVFREMAEVA